MKIGNRLRGQAMVFMRGINRAAPTRVPSEKKSLGQRLRVRIFGGSAGNTLVESAFVLPILLAVIVGIFKVGLLYSNYLTLTNAVNKAAIALQPGADFIASGNAAPYTDPCTLVTSTIKAVAPTMNSAQITYTVVLNNTSNYPVLSSGATQEGPTTGTFSCSSAPTLLSQTNVTVIATYACDLNILNNFAPSCKLKAESTVQVI